MWWPTYNLHDIQQQKKKKKGYKSNSQEEAIKPSVLKNQETNFVNENQRSGKEAEVTP